MESTDFFLFPDKQEESLFLFLFVLFYLIFKPLCAACGILFSQPGIEPTPLALEVWSLNHWTTREVTKIDILKGSDELGTVSALENGEKSPKGF